MGRARKVRPKITWHELARFLTNYLRLISLSSASAFEFARSRLEPQSAAARLLPEGSSKKATRQWAKDVGDAYLNLYIEMTVLEGRISGDIPVLGGIRVVKEVVAE